MTALTAFWRNDARATADAAPASLRIAHGILALGIIAIFLCRTSPITFI